MVTTHGKGTHKANSGPEDRGSKTTSDAEKSTIAKKDKTHLSEHQPASPKASLEQPWKGCGCHRKVTAIDGPTIHEVQAPAPIDDLPNDADVPQVPHKQCKAGDTWKGAVVPLKTHFQTV